MRMPIDNQADILRKSLAQSLLTSELETMDKPDLKTFALNRHHFRQR
jgi:hypothetical protein